MSGASTLQAAPKAREVCEVKCLDGWFLEADLELKLAVQVQGRAVAFEVLVGGKPAPQFFTVTSY